MADELTNDLPPDEPQAAAAPAPQAPPEPAAPPPAVPDALAELDISDPADREPAPAPTPAGARVAEAAAVAPGTPASETPAFPAELLERAAEVNITEAEARAFKDPAELERTLNLLDRQAARLYRRQAAAESAPAKAPAPEPEEPTLDEGFDEKLRARDKFLAERLQKLEQREAEREQELQFLRQQRAQQRNDELDAAFADLADTVPAVGKQKFGELTPQAAEFKARAAVIDLANDIAAGLARRNQPLPPERELLKRAAVALHADEVAKRAASGANRALGERLRDHANGRFTSRPTHRAGAPLVSADSVARQNLRNRLADKGIDPGPDVDPDLEGLPD